MFKAISLLLLLGAFTPMAGAQRGVCPQGNDPGQACPRVTRTDQPSAPAIGELRGQARRGAQSLQGRQGRASGRGACRSSCRGQGRGAGGGRGRGFGMGRGSGPRRAASSPPASPQPRSNARGFRRGLGSAQPRAITARGTTTVSSPVVPGRAQTFLDRLQATLEAELYAKEYYQAAARALNGFRRYQNLAKAENNHANAIAHAIELLGGTPIWVQNEPIIPPRTIAQADGHCREIELHVIDVYEGLIADAPTSQLEAIFQKIQKANYQHLSVVGG